MFFRHHELSNPHDAREVAAYARPMPVSLDTKPREISAGSFVVCALNMHATGGEQVRLWGQARLAVNETHFDGLSRLVSRWVG